MKLITKKVGKLQTNCYILINDGKAALVDPGGDAQELAELLNSEQASLNQIVLTHGHADHVADASELKRLYGGTILINGLDKPYLEAVSDQMAIYLGLKEAISPDAYFADGDTIDLAGIPFVVIGTPGHTPGSCCFYNEEFKTLISGDTLFASSIGRADLAGGDPKLLELSLQRLKTLPEDTNVYPGHGPATTIGRERVRNRYW